MKVDRLPPSRIFALIAAALLSSTRLAQAQTTKYEFNDSHFHLTNYIQEGADIHDFVSIIGNPDSGIRLRST